MFVTSLPDPRPGCERIESDFWTTIVFHRCGDCIFSGHAAVGTLFSLYWLFVKPTVSDGSFQLLRIGIWLTSVAEIWAILANRSHYTIDVLVAIYISIGIFFTFSYAWDKAVTSKGRLADLTDPDNFVPIEIQ